MKSIWTKIETASPEEAGQLHNALRHQLLKSVFFAMAAMAVVAFAAIAWFVSNTQVHSGTAAVSAGFEPIKLATKGVRQQVEIDNLNLPIGEQLKDADGNVIPEYSEYYYTEGETIALRLNGTNYEVSPGARGKVEFYIIPSRDGAATVTLQFGLGGYGADENDNNIVKPIDDPVLDALLSGHILLFGSYANGYYTDWLLQPASDSIFNNAITVNLPDTTKAGVPKAVSFYWIWPLRYENLANDLVADNNTAIRSFIEEQAADDAMANLSSGYRYSRIFLTNQANLTNDTRSKAYDFADEYIGSNAQYLYLTIQTSASDVAEGGQAS